MGRAGREERAKPGWRAGAQAGAVLGVLGYGEVAPVRLPAGMVSRVPLGSALDPAAVLG
ncbi:hypothetical protein GCM10022380_15870 [Amycolatopsis tucumanensis]|uniref:Uncharacterized protein n=1 Tax=Amycolatopsis tucumanensis TaxID=401106 RepID=A0ABP7HVD8_9PSEU